MKFISIGSSLAKAARSNISSSRSTTLANESLKIPLSEAKTSIRGRFNFSKGMRSNLTTRPVPSLTGSAPTNARTIATDSPRVLIASSPHRVTATVSGYAPSFASRCCRIISFAAFCPLAHAPALGMRYGSSACMFRPVGNTDVPSRSKSPPGAGGTYPPERALMTLSISSVVRHSRWLISVASFSIMVLLCVLVVARSSSCCF
mmetsp:Transcript_5320/g.7657  ORF Transcript_5320/g.7657 Transcript_5320/m.7657 type:complete len:204 (+) Transcript_5320:942-1553(+)